MFSTSSSARHSPLTNSLPPVSSSPTLRSLIKVKAQAVEGEEGERYVEEAVHFYQRAIQLLPDEVNAQYNLGALLYNYESRLEPDPQAGMRHLARAQEIFLDIYMRERAKQQAKEEAEGKTVVKECALQLVHDWTGQEGVSIEYIGWNTSTSTSTRGYPRRYGSFAPRMIEKSATGAPHDAREGKEQDAREGKEQDAKALLRNRGVLLAPSSNSHHQTMLYDRCEEVETGTGSCLFRAVFTSPGGNSTGSEQCTDGGSSTCGTTGTGLIRISGPAGLIHDNCRIFVPSQGGFVPSGGLDFQLHEERTLYVDHAASAAQMSAGSFYHFMVEVLARVAFLLPLLQDRSLRLVLPAVCEGRAFVTGALNALGVPPEQWLFLPEGYTLAVRPGGRLHYVDWRRDGAQNLETTERVGTQLEGEAFAAAAMAAAVSRPGLQFSPPQMALQLVSRLLRTSLAESAESAERAERRQRQQQQQEEDTNRAAKLRVRIVLVSRSRKESGKENNGRSVINEQEVLMEIRALVEETNAIADSKGYELELRVFTGEQATLHESFRAFGGEIFDDEDAKGEVLVVVLGVHGAGLTNMLLAPPPATPLSTDSALDRIDVARTRTAVVEFMLPHPDARDYMHLSAALGFEYWGIPDLPRNSMFLDVMLDPARVRTVVAAAADSLVSNWREGVVAAQS
jgi:hypothetical protein